MQITQPRKSSRGLEAASRGRTREQAGQRYSEERENNNNIPSQKRKKQENKQYLYIFISTNQEAEEG